MPKLKTHSGAKKRFKLSKNGKVIRGHANTSHLLNGLKKAGVTLNRKMLSEIAIADPAGFTALVEKAKAAL